MPRPPAPFLIVVGAVTMLLLTGAAGPILVGHGTPEAGTPGIGTPGAGTPDAGTPTAASPTAEVPPAAGAVVDVVVAEASASVDVPEDQVQVVHVEARDWPDASLGCPEEGSLYAQVITPGYLIRVTAGGEPLEYHTDATGSIITLCEPGS